MSNKEYKSAGGEELGWVSSTLLSPEKPWGYPQPHYFISNQTAKHREKLRYYRLLMTKYISSDLMNNKSKKMKQEYKMAIFLLTGAVVVHVMIKHPKK